MFNFANVYTIYYKKPANLHKTYPQNHSRHIGSRIVCGIEATRAAVAEIVSAGFEVDEIWSGIGRRVTL